MQLVDHESNDILCSWLTMKVMGLDCIVYIGVILSPSSGQALVFCN